MEPAPSVDRRTAHRGRCALRREVNRSATNPCCPSSGGRGVGDAAPYGGCVWVGVSGAVRYVGGVGMVFRTRYDICRSACFAPAVRGGVLDAPRSWDCRAGLVASVRRVRQHPRFPRCACLAPTTPRMQSRGHSPCTIDRREGTAYIASYAATVVSQSPVGRTVLGAPRLRDCRGNVGADGRRDRLHPCFLRCAR